MIILVTGDRNWGMQKDVRLARVDKSVLYGQLRSFHLSDSDLIVEGGCPTGADTLAREWAIANAIPHEREDANWDKYGKKAGPIRNKKMLDEYHPDLVLGFHNNILESRGTAHMLWYAHDNKVPTECHPKDLSEEDWKILDDRYAKYKAIGIKDF